MSLSLMLMLAGLASVLSAYANAGGGLAVGVMTGGAIAFWLGVLVLAFS